MRGGYLELPGILHNLFNIKELTYFPCRIQRFTHWAELLGMFQDMAKIFLILPVLYLTAMTKK